ncbi:hypothetical protein ACIQU2_02640 [Pseudomonas sp. NPDC098740]|uniref:hypothetical protein n=1 Tax=Pseudomonas sp. NPDC098740 TaxID=3364486 RepID=UPI00383B5BCD
MHQQQIALDSNTREKLIVFLSYLLIALPILSLILNLTSWLRFGIDMPLMDDWRQYRNNTMGDIEPSYLFKSVNDTLSPVGLFLDAMAFKFLDGNTIAYQFISMLTILGSLLLLQWKLLKICVENIFVRSCAFSTTILMLQPDTYWGWSNLAYHQAIPLVCILACLYLTLSERWPVKKTIPLIIGIGFISGLSYISGAFAILGLSLTFIITQIFIATSNKRRLLTSGLSLLIPAIVTTCAQLWVIVGVQHGTHRADAPMAYPWESDFWFFLLGKVARSLMLPVNHPLLSLSVTLVALAIVAITVVILIKQCRRKTQSPVNASLTTVISSLIATISLYLLLIAAGRTNLRPENITTFLDIFSFGFYRFHFYWVTLLWPWMTAAILIWLLRTKPSGIAKNTTAIIFTALMLSGIKYTNIFEHKEFYLATMQSRLDGIQCLQNKIQANENLLCKQLELSDLNKAIANGKRTGASFSRNLFYIPIALGTNTPAPLYRLSEHTNEIHLTNAQRTNNSSNEIKIRTEIDPNLLIRTGKPDQLLNCRSLEVNVKINTMENDLSQLFFLPIGKSSFTETDSKTIPISHNDGVISFNMTSESGFLDTLRFDPVTSPQLLSLSDLEVRCRENITH